MDPLSLSVSHVQPPKHPLLQAEMKRRSGKDVEPVGEFAPIDLAGRTPLGWSVRKARPELEQELFALGDPSIFPTIPLHR